ncbi:MAG: hypothetical protein MUD12_05020 [Spirochaetes bacterium]|jgi:hypothetical protein|nr:hypothetical protein [Spirochaetota bacterium]
MKKSSCIAAALFFSLLFSVGYYPADQTGIALFAQESSYKPDTALFDKKQKDVMDYYLLMPRDFFKSIYKKPHEFTSVQESRMKAVRIKDTENGYLRLENFLTDDAGFLESYAEIKVFKKTGGGDIIAVFNTNCGPSECGRLCSTNLAFYELNGKTWKDISKNMIGEVPQDRIKKEYLKKMNRQFCGDTYPVVYKLSPKENTVKLIVDPGHSNSSEEITLFKYTWVKNSFRPE